MTMSAWSLPTLPRFFKSFKINQMHELRDRQLNLQEIFIHYVEVVWDLQRGHSTKIWEKLKQKKQQ